jgi:ADP-ribose pyrophosphatase YjhB (NUDIX family)
MNTHEDELPPSILAAGGIVRGVGAEEGKIAVVRRRRYGNEVGLPKGKVKAGEDLRTAALREVREETGYSVEIVEHAGTTSYMVGTRPKLVSYFIMKVTDSGHLNPIDGDEIESVEWVTPREAISKLTYREDRSLVASLFSIHKTRHASIKTPIRDIGRRLFGSPEYDRLTMTIAEARADLDRQVDERELAIVGEPWARSADNLLRHAEAHLTNWQLVLGWDAVLAAQRAILSNPHNLERLQRAEITLRREADKITGWRAKAIQDLLAPPKDELKGTKPQDYMRIVDAVALRDDYSQNTWYKINLRRRHLLSLFVILWLALFAFVTLSWVQFLPGFLGNGPEVCAVVLFGVLGAAVSVAQSFVDDDVRARIPMQQVGSFLVWMRPGIGAAAAVALFALLHANETLKLFPLITTDLPVVMALCFVAGYSERFIIGTVGKISASALDTKSG